MVGRPRDAPRLTAEDIIEAALGLTRERGLDGWTVRDLGAVLHAWPNNLYHHVGDRDAVVRAVLERVVAAFPVPPASLPWQRWFRLLLSDARPVLRAHRGAAMRLCRDGPSIPSAVAIIDRGVGVLVRAGFGDDAPRAYSALLNGALLLIAVEDERVRAGRAGHQAADSLLGMDPPAAADPDGWATMSGYLARWVADPEAALAQLYSYNLDLLIAGAAAQRDARPGRDLKPASRRRRGAAPRRDTKRTERG